MVGQEKSHCGGGAEWAAGQQPSYENNVQSGVWEIGPIWELLFCRAKALPALGWSSMPLKAIIMVRRPTTEGPSLISNPSLALLRFSKCSKI